MILKKFAFVALALIGLAQPAEAANRKPIVVGSTGQQQQIQSTDTLATPAPTTANASINLPHGTAPASPTNGDCWTTTLGLYCRVNGATVGPMNVGSAIAFKDEGSTLTSSTTSVDCVGSGVTCTNSSGAVTVTVSGGGSSIISKDEGSTLTSGTTSFNFTGSGVTATNLSGDVTVNIPGSTGGSRPVLTQLLKTTAQAVPNSSWTVISWNTTAVVNDVSGAFSSGSPTLITVPSGQGIVGVRLRFRAAWANSGGNYKYYAIYCTRALTGLGSNVALSITQTNNEAGGYLETPYIGLAEHGLQVGDSFWVQVLQTSGGSLNFSPASGFGQATFEAEWYR